MATTAEIAEKLVEHCRNHTEAEGLKTLYADDAVSVEANPMPGGTQVSEGREAIAGKHAWWAENFEVHEAIVEGPFIHGDTFGVIFEIEATDKASDMRWRAKELGLYHVKDGKIIREEFFQAPMPG